MNLLYHVPQAERAAEEDSRKRLAQEMSRLQSTLEYLLLKGDTAVAQHEIAVLAHNHDVILAALTDDRQRGHRRDAARVARAADRRRAAAVRSRAGGRRDPRASRRHDRSTPNGDALLGYAGILIGGERDELRPSRTGSLFLAYDLKRYKAEARAQVLQQSLYWAGWVTALALAMWLAFHFLLTRRTARLVRAAEAARRGQPRRAQRPARHRRARPPEPRVRRDGARGRRHADATAQDIAERKRAAEALRVSEASYRAIFDAAEDAIFVHDIDTRRHRRRQSQGVRDVRLHARGIPRSSTSARSAPARRRSTTKRRDGPASRARAPASSCASNGTARARTARCAGTKCSSSA